MPFLSTTIISEGSTSLMASVPIISRGAFSDAIITSPFFDLPIKSGLNP